MCSTSSQGHSDIFVPSDMLHIIHGSREIHEAYPTLNREQLLNRDLPHTQDDFELALQFKIVQISLDCPSVSKLPRNNTVFVIRASSKATILREDYKRTCSNLEPSMLFCFAGRALRWKSFLVPPVWAVMAHPCCKPRITEGGAAEVPIVSNQSENSSGEQ